MNIDRRKRVFKKIYGLVDGTLIFMDSDGYVLESSDDSRVGGYIDLPSFNNDQDRIMYRGWSFRQFKGHDGRLYVLALDNKKQTTQTIIELISIMFEEDSDDLTSEEVITDYLKDRITDEVALELAGKIKEDLEKKYTVCIVEHKSGIADEMESILRNLVPDAYTVPFDNTKILLIFKDDNIDEVLMSVMVAVSEELLVEPKIGVGTEVEGFLKMKDSFNDAITALGVLKTYRTTDKISYYKKMALPIIINEMPWDQLNRIYKAISGNIHIVIDDDELILTAQRFFEHSLNVTDTSQVLFIHRNTLIYRLNKIEKLTGFDLRKFEDALNFYIGLYMNNRIKQ